jgi:hypothetical protein
MRWRVRASASSSSRWVPGDLAFERRRGHVDHHRIALAGQPGRRQQDFMPGAGLVALERAAQDAVERHRVGEQLGDGPATGFVQPDGEQILRSDVGVDHAQVGIEHHHAGGQYVQQIRRIEMRQRRWRDLFKSHRAPPAGRAAAAAGVASVGGASVPAGGRGR